MKQMFHFLLDDEAQKNVEFIRKNFLKTGNVDLSKAATMRAALRLARQSQEKALEEKALEEKVLEK